jgi:hypothetical protein
MSVILMVDRQRTRGARALGSLLPQSTEGSLEVLLLDFGWREHPPLVGCEHPSVRVLRSDRGVAFGAARAAGVLEARAPIVGFLEEHCVALPGWADAYLSAHDGPVAAVGGEVRNATPGDGFTEFIWTYGSGPWSRPARRGPSARLAGNNSSYKRDVLLRYGDDLPLLLADDGLLSDWLVRDRQTLWIEPAAGFTHAFEASPRLVCNAAFWYGWVCESTRVALDRWSPGRRAGRAAVLLATLLARPAWPFLRLVWADPRRAGILVRNLPAMLLFHWCGTAGRVMGLALGLRRADVHRLDHDLNAVRRSP